VRFNNRPTAILNNGNRSKRCPYTQYLIVENNKAFTRLILIRNGRVVQRLFNNLIFWGEGGRNKSFVQIERENH